MKKRPEGVMHFRHSFLKWVGVSVGMLLLLFLFRGVWLQGIANFLVTKENYVPSDVIIVLGGETRGERTARAVELYRKGLAPRILFSDGTSLSWRIRAIDEMVALAKKLGVPEEAIFKEDRSRSTYENAVYTKEILQRNHWNSAIVVTSYWHSHRSKMTFDRVYKGSGISLTYANSGDLLTPNLDRWWEDSERQQVVLTELAKYLVYWIKY